MPKITAKLIIEPVFLIEKTNLSKCSACDDIICSDMYRCFLMPKAGKLNLFGHETNFVLCESCFNAYKEIKH